MLVMSIFVIIVLSFLAIAMSRLLGTASDALVYEVYGLRAMNAARSGLEQKVLEVFAGQTSDPALCTNIPATDSREFYTLGLENCSTRFACQVTTVDATNYYRFESTGTCQIEDVIVSRTIAIDARDVSDE